MGFRITIPKEINVPTGFIYQISINGKFKTLKDYSIFAYFMDIRYWIELDLKLGGFIIIEIRSKRQSKEPSEEVYVLYIVYTIADGKYVDEVFIFDLLYDYRDYSFTLNFYVPPITYQEVFLEIFQNILTVLQKKDADIYSLDYKFVNKVVFNFENNTIDPLQNFKIYYFNHAKRLNPIILTPYEKMEVISEHLDKLFRVLAFWIAKISTVQLQYLNQLFKHFKR